MTAPLIRSQRIASLRRELRYKHVGFWDRVLLDAPTDCWDFLGALAATGYGVASTGPNTQELAHRHAWQLLRGPIPTGLTIDHLCLNRQCCNPQHMEVVTREENSRRGEKNRKTRSGGRFFEQRTECKHGHPYTEGSYLLRGNARICRLCARIRVQQFQDRRRGA